MEEKTRGNKFSKVIILLLIGLVIFFSNKENQDKFVNYINSLSIGKKSLHVDKSVFIDNQIEKVTYGNNKILVWGNNKLSLYDLNGSKEWEKEFNLNSPDVLFGNDRVYVYDRISGDIYCLNSSGETLTRIQIGTEIKSVTENGERLLVHTVEQNNEGLKILDSNGNIVDDRSLENRILTYCIEDDNRKYAICTLNLADQSVKTEVQIYEIKKELVSALSFEDEISLYANFLRKDRLLVLTDSNLYFIENGSVLWKREMDNVKDISVDENSIYILNSNSYKAISKDGDVRHEYSFTQDYDSITTIKNYVVLWSSDGLVGLRDGKEMFKYQPKDEIYDVIEGDQYLLIIYQNRIDLLSY